MYHHLVPRLRTPRSPSATHLVARPCLPTWRNGLRRPQFERANTIRRHKSSIRQ